MANVKVTKSMWMGKTSKRKTQKKTKDDWVGSIKRTTSKKSWWK